MAKPRILVIGRSNTDMIIKLDRIPSPGKLANSHGGDPEGTLAKGGALAQTGSSGAFPPPVNFA